MGTFLDRWETLEGNSECKYITSTPVLFLIKKKLFVSFKTQHM